jgi:shikimate dehydrogenase
MTGRIAGVVGWPIAQSLSPVIHNYWLKIYEIAGSYVALPITPENFSQCVAALPLMGFAGVNVTVPHKQAAAALSQSLDADAAATGAVNLLVFSAGGICGYNTDVKGFGDALGENLPVQELTSGPAVVLGAGGASRAIVLALFRAGFRQVRILNRSRDRAGQIAELFHSAGNCSVFEWGDWEPAFAGAQLLVNTTSLGMKGKPPLDIRLDALPRSAAVVDIVYNPVGTGLLAAAAAAGHRTMDGLGMLMHQAAPAFEAWFGIRPDVTAQLRRLLLEALNRG